MANNNNNNPVLDAQAFADAHLYREEQKALGNEADVFCSVVDLGSAFHADVPTTKLIQDVGLMLRQRDLHLKAPELLKTTNAEKFVNACAVSGKCGQLISTAKGPVLVNLLKSHRMDLMELTTDKKKLDACLGDLLQQTDSLRVGPNDQFTRNQVDNLKDDERDILEQIANGEVDDNNVPVAMPVPNFQTQINQLTVMARQEYAGRVQDWFETMMPPLLTTKVQDLKRDKRNHGGKADQKGGDKSESVKGPLPRMCVDWAWGCCNTEGRQHPHKRVGREDFKVMAESRVLGARLKGLKYDDLPEDDKAW
eukprot:g16844.t1